MSNNILNDKGIVSIKDRVFRCNICSIPFRPVKNDQKYCSRECQLEFQMDREKKLKRIRELLSSKFSIDDARRLSGIESKEFYLLMEIITRHSVEPMLYACEFTWNSHNKVKEMDILGKYRIKREWRLPNTAVNVGDFETVGDGKSKEK